MKIVLSRKGFDSASGGCPSPIVDGRPVSLPIPASKSSQTTYDCLGLGDMVTRLTRKRHQGTSLCHHDPMFVGDECIFGQCDAAQSHLANQGVGPGDVFLFFGLFAEERTGERHHRLFGYLRVDAVHRIDEAPADLLIELEALQHPHVLGLRSPNNTVYRGKGATASHAHDTLRLTRPGGPLSRWVMPSWLGARGLSYHGDARRWVADNELQVVARGQEFVCDIGDESEPREWLEDTIARIRS